MAAERVLVPVSESPTLRQTVAYAVDRVLEDASDDEAAVRFAFVHSPDADAEAGSDGSTDASRLLERAEIWATEDAGEAELSVETTHVGSDRYLFSPADIADAIATEARRGAIERVVIDPEYDPGIGAPLVRPLVVELSDFEGIRVEEASVGRRTVRGPLLERTSATQVGALFVVAFGFYQILAGNLDWVTASPDRWFAEIYWFDVITGAIAATVVALALARVAFSGGPTRSSPVRLARFVLYVPYLLWEIIKANVLVSLVILNPRLPIEPRMTRIRPAVWGGLPVTTLANSITLTPGTLTVRVEGRELRVHTLVPAARQGLFDGGLERAVRFVFYGRGAATVPGLADRGEAELLEYDTTDGSRDGDPAGVAQTDDAHGGNPTDEDHADDEAHVDENHDHDSSDETHADSEDPADDTDGRRGEGS